MPADPNPTPPAPAGKPRRRSGPAAGGNWLWLWVVLSLVAFWLLVTQMNHPGSPDYGDFLALINDKDASKEIKRVAFQGTDTILVEVDRDKLQEPLRSKITSNRFTVKRLQVREDQKMVERLQDLATRKDNPIRLEQ